MQLRPCYHRSSERIRAHLYGWTPFILPGDRMLFRWRLRRELRAVARALDFKIPILWLDPEHTPTPRP